MRHVLATIPITLLFLCGHADASDIQRRRDLPEIEASSLRGSVTWEGAYVGGNLGYAGGANDTASTGSYPLYDNINSTVASQARLLSPAVFGVSSLTNKGSGLINGSGLIGGLQAGYNMYFGNDFVTGLETDFQFSSMAGSSMYMGAPVTQSLSYRIGATENGTLENVFSGRGNVTAGLNWLGTLRARFGYLFFPELMIYGTGGFAYGDVRAHSENAYVQNTTDRSSDGFTETTSIYNAFSSGGRGSGSSVKLGWTGGGGLEWMVMPNWSVKAEGLYYSLGNYNLKTGIVSISPLTANWPTTRLQYDGFIVRGGLNYHFNYAGTSYVTAKY